MTNTQTQQALLTILVHAAMADGGKSESERELIRNLAQQINDESGTVQLAQAVQSALLGKTSVGQACALLDEPTHRQLAYEWAVAVCHADGVCSEAEAAFLHTLKQQLKLEGESNESQVSQSVAIAAYQEEAAAPVSVAAPLPMPVPSATPVQAVDEVAIDRMILNYAILNGALELLPQSWASMAIIPLQIKMVFRVGKGFGVSLDQGHIKEFIAAAGVGLTSQYVEQFGRKLLGGLVGKAGGKMLGGFTGQATGMAFSFATTYALGHLAKRYYAGGRVMSTQLLRQTYQGLLGPAKNLQSQYGADIQNRASTLDAAEVMRMVRG